MPMPPPPVQLDTRERFIAAASKLFAEKGFYGASMDQIACELNLTKQALIHHFGTKEKLYGAVLNEISQRLLGELEVHGANDPDEPEQAFTNAVLRIYQATQERQTDTQLLMRELLDNRRRTAQAGTWYLRPFLDGLHQFLRQVPQWRDADQNLIATHIYQILGAINYFSVSGATLEKMYSAEHVSAMRDAFPERLRRMAMATPDVV